MDGGGRLLRNLVGRDPAGAVRKWRQRLWVSAYGIRLDAGHRANLGLVNPNPVTIAVHGYISSEEFESLCRRSRCGKFPSRRRPSPRPTDRYP
jgi:hypothetical protein